LCRGHRVVRGGRNDKQKDREPGKDLLLFKLIIGKKERWGKKKKAREGGDIS